MGYLNLTIGITASALFFKINRLAVLNFSPVTKGAVWKIQQTYSNFLPRFSYSRSTSARTGIIMTRSPEFFFDLKNGTRAPQDLATRAISGSSVETIISLKQAAFFAAPTEYFIIGWPAKFFIFFLGILLLPPLAGIIAKIFIF